MMVAVVWYLSVSMSGLRSVYLQQLSINTSICLTSLSRCSWNFFFFLSLSLFLFLILKRIVCSFLLLHYFIYYTYTLLSVTFTQLVQYDAHNYIPIYPHIFTLLFYKLTQQNYINLPQQ